MAGSPSSSRPLSPHLQIWRFTVTMAASITHRATGVANAAGIFLFCLWAVALAIGGPFYDRVAAFFVSPLGVAFCIGYIWSLSYHLLNGLRHLYWDSGRGLGLETAKKTAWAVYIGSVILTFIFVSLAGRA